MKKTYEVLLMAAILFAVLIASDAGAAFLVTN